MNDRPDNSNIEPGDSELRAPAALVEALRRLEEREPVQVPLEQDDRILSKCHEALVQRLNARDSSSVGENHLQRVDANRSHELDAGGGAGTPLPAFDGQPKGGLGETRPTFVFVKSSSQIRHSGETSGDNSAKQKRFGSRILRIPFRRPRWAAAAAIVVLAFASAYWVRRPAPDVAINVENPTILDVFALARRIEARRQTDRRFDLDGDSQIDRSDVDLLAQKAVALPEGGAL